MFDRASGILMHISCLPSPYGIGTMGREAFRFVDFLAEAGQSFWQVLPLGYTGYGDSPYQCFSAAAGNPYFIDLDLLCAQGLLSRDDLKTANASKAPDAVDFEALAKSRFPTLRKAFDNADEVTLGKAWAFRRENGAWLEDFALFMALKKHFGGLPVWLWPDETIKRRDGNALLTYGFHLKKETDFQIFLQYLFFEQWKKLKSYANSRGVHIIGDIPIYVSPDSVEVWANPELFKLQPDLSPKFVAGVPPDYYSETGQRWGNPVYDWEKHAETGYAWWLWRIRQNRLLFDVLRIDHFRGFETYWEIPAGEESAVDGKWENGPGMALFNTITDRLGELPIIAEDLGDIDDRVRCFLKASGYPGMRVLIFGFDAETDNEHLPHNYPVNLVAYTSTHDSESVCEQIMDKCSEKDRYFAYQYLRTVPNEPLGWSAIKSVFASPACLAMTTMQDLLSLGKDARMNIPATLGLNWKWRIRKEAINADVAKVLCDITKTYKRYHNRGKYHD